MMYALGEIALVVIGILIALQIDDWNETRKNRIFEKEMLGEVARALEADKVYFERMLGRLAGAEQASQSLLRDLAGGSLSADSLKATYRKLFLGVMYEYNPGPYEAIKSAGLDRLSSKTLRSELISFYDFAIKRNRDLVQWADRNYTQQVERLKALRSTTTKIDSTNGRFEVVQELPADLIRREEFILLLDDISSRNRLTHDYLEPLLQEMDNLLALINQELARD